MTIYKSKDGRYQVTVEDNGAIKVKSGDWLSKYSAAMYNDFSHIHEFGRKNDAGVVEPVKDKNLIIAGETLYHIPTYKAHLKGPKAPPPGRQTAPKGTWTIVEPPEITKQENPIDRWIDLVEKQHKKSIKGIAANAIGITEGFDQSIVFSMLGLVPRKPLWWDSRLQRIAAAQGKPLLVQKVYLLRRDLQEYFYWENEMWRYYQAWFQDKSSKEKRAKLEEVGGYMEWARLNANKLAREIYQMTEE